MPLLGSCKEIQIKYPSAVSGDYNIMTKSGAKVRVYCELGFNGGGYTFLHPSAFYQITPADVTAMVTDTSNVLMRILKADGSQRFNVLSQLNQYALVVYCV